MYDEPCRPFPWNGAYRASFLKDAKIHFPEGLPLGEDQVFSFSTVGRAQGIRFSSARLYGYRVSRKDSAMALFADNHSLRIDQHLTMISSILDEWESQGRLTGESANNMARFVCDFIVPDLFLVDYEADLERLCGRYRDILLSHFSNIVSFDKISDCPSCLWTSDILKGFDLSALFSGNSKYRYTAKRAGRRAALRCFRADSLKRIRSVLGIASRRALEEAAELNAAYRDDAALSEAELASFEDDYANLTKVYDRRD